MLQSQDYLFQIDVHYLLVNIFSHLKNIVNVYCFISLPQIKSIIKRTFIPLHMLTKLILFILKENKNQQYIYIVWFHEKLIMYGSIEDNAFCPRILSHLHCQMWPFPLILKDHSLENDKTL